MGLFDRLRGKPTIDDFATMMIRAIRAGGGTGDYRYEAAEHVIYQSKDGETTSQINLANMYRTYIESDPKDRPEHLRTFVRVTLGLGRTMPEDYELAKVDLRPRLWTRSTLEFQRLRGVLGDEKEAEVVSLPVGGHLVMCLAYDWPEAVQSVSPDWLETWGVTIYQAFEDAKANLEQATEGYAAFGTNLYSFIAGDSYDATRMVLTDHIAALEVRGRHVVMVPNRNAALITGTEDEEGLTMMAALAAEAIGEGYPLIAVPLVLDDDGEWAEWLPPEGHPLRRPFREMQLKWIGPEYSEQKTLLDAIHQKTGDDVFVASFSAVEKENDGGIVSYCVWSEGVPTLLPETNKVVFARSTVKGPAGIADWEQMMQAVGHLLEPTEDYPPRYRTLGFPDDATLEAIGQGEM